MAQGAGAARTKQPPSTLYLSLEQVEQWVAKARRGAMLTYAVGPALDPAHPVAARVRRLVITGDAIAVKERKPDGALHHRVVRRDGSPAAPAEAEGRAAGPCDPDFAESPEGVLYRHLARLANVGQACPSNAVLAERLGWADADAVKYRLRLLTKAGILRFDTNPRHAGRVVIVCATGRRTADGAEA